MKSPLIQQQQHATMANTPLAATEILVDVQHGNRAAVDRLLPLVYDELRDLAGRYVQRESPGITLQPTALVHEAYVKLIDQSRVNWQGRTHFFAIGAQAMRRILVDHARQRRAAKRGGDRQRVALDEQLLPGHKREEDLLALDDALAKLTQLDPRQAEIVELRFFGGLSVAEVADVTETPKRTVEREWTAIRAWLRRELSDEGTA